MTRWQDLVAYLKPECDALRRTYNRPISYAAAWKTCSRGDWMRWLVKRLGVLEPVQEAAYWRGLDRASKDLRRRADLDPDSYGDELQQASADLIRGLYPEPPSLDPVLELMEADRLAKLEADELGRRLAQSKNQVTKE